ncbi:MAG: hypothetical protein IJ000_05930 [Paludibacteraceae bacterium]|nr:hypothetical protein [Paludibacteraceae bacterium]
MNVFLSVLLCAVLCVGVLTSLSTTDESASQYSQKEHTSSIPTNTGTPTVSFGVGARGNDLAVPMSSRPSRGSVRHLSSHRLVTSSPNSLITSSPNSPIASSSNSLITYTSSSQTMKSFGGGSNAAGVSMSGGVVSTNNLTTSSPNTPLTLSPNTPLTSSPNNLITSSPNTLLALSPNNLITSSPNNLLTSSPNGLFASSTGARGIGGRHNAPGTLGGEDNNYINWLESEGWIYGEGCLTLSEQELRDLYVALTGDNSFQNEDQWNAFWEWFMGKQSDDSFKWKLPLSDAIPFLLLLAMAYVFYIFLKTRKQIQTK